MMICGQVQIVMVREKLRIEYNSTFRKNFGVIWDFISNDSIKRADNFKNQLKARF